MAQSDNVLKSVDTVFKIIKHLETRGGTTVTELASEREMPKSTAQVYLNTLHANGLVVKDDGEYKIGLRFLKYGMHALWNQQVFPRVRDKVDELAESTGELASCFVEERGDAVYIYGTEGSQAIRTDLSIGDRSGLHCTASGKAILANLPQQRIDTLLDVESFQALTDQTIVEPETLRDELETIRERGFAYSHQESVKGMRAVAAPISIEDHVVGSISLAGPANRFVGDRFERELPEIVTGAANEMELKLTYSESGL
ncbi:IclR family transcriptional regulator [Haloarcula sp. 1CSR25-25]|uniref:IclR family transcriptional regulator n=1 Tax=Haloarcula sp. 1CSR25-25 TaxID=2862545 RepID=UPI002893AC80|nr:IclR family transcriptional regulator [Haloarcula sp. 1CSR25-25]MDT3437158.1 IclR family transcriptional regulator [Haloarcula sp. 1CSR25-25]